MGIFNTLFSDTAKHMLDQLQPLPIVEYVEEESEKAYWKVHQANRNWNFLTIQLYLEIVPRKIVAMIGITAFFQYKYYVEHCVRQLDGSWVSKDIHMPAVD